MGTFAIIAVVSLVAVAVGPALSEKTPLGWGVWSEGVRWVFLDHTTRDFRLREQATFFPVVRTDCRSVWTAAVGRGGKGSRILRYEPYVSDSEVAEEIPLPSVDTVVSLQVSSRPDEPWVYFLRADGGVSRVKYGTPDYEIQEVGSVGAGVEALGANLLFGRRGTNFVGRLNANGTIQPLALVPECGTLDYFYCSASFKYVAVLCQNGQFWFGYYEEKWDLITWAYAPDRNDHALFGHPASLDGFNGAVVSAVNSQNGALIYERTFENKVLKFSNDTFTAFAFDSHIMGCPPT